MAVGVREDGHERTIELVTRRTPLQHQVLDALDTLAVNTSSWDRAAIISAEGISAHPQGRR